MRFTITIDDDDRANTQSAPWTATIECSTEGVEAAGSGIGSTPEDALTSLLSDLWQHDDELLEAWTTDTEED